MTITITDQQYAEFGKRVAALLGAQYEWGDADEYLEWIADWADRHLDQRVDSQAPEVLAAWRERADSLGIEHDGEPNPECECEDYFDTSEVYDESNSLIASGEHEHRDAGLPGTDDLTGCAVAGCLCEHVADWGPWL